MSLSKSTPRASRNRTPVSLSHRLDPKLLGYAAAASAAGVAILALAQPSQAEIVFTPTHQMIPMRGTLELDLNHDGITDFTIHNIIGSCGSPRALECSQYTLQALDVDGNSAMNGALVGTRWASALSAGKRVGPGGKFTAVGSMEQCHTLFGEPAYSSGPWINVQNRYLGLAFIIEGHTHYGWARVSVTIKPGDCRPTSAVLTGYAYETVPGKPIATGKRSSTAEVSAVERPQATLGLLAQGCVGLDAWRRDENAESESGM